MASILLVGATGLVGSHVLARALADVRIDRVVAPSRHALPPNRKLLAPVVDFRRLPSDADWWSIDGAICALGTTRATAESAEEGCAVEHDYPLAVASLVRTRGCARFALTSVMGADAHSRLRYLRTKGELEDDLAALDFQALTLVRPSLIGGQRAELRPTERAAQLLFGAFEPLLPRRYRISPAPNIAQALIEGALASTSGRRVIEADRLTNSRAGTA